METAKPREPATRPSTAWPPPNSSHPAGEKPVPDPNDRWNWWILNHGLLIAAVLIAAALVTVSLRFASDRRDAHLNSAGPTVRPGVNIAKQVPTTTGPTTIASQVLAQTVTPSVPTTATPLSTSIPPAAGATTLTAATTIAPTTSLPATTTIAATTTTITATTTTIATTTTQATSTSTEAPVSGADAAKQLPHLQLGQIPVTWVQVTRRITSRPQSRPTEPALSFRWIGSQKDTSVLLQIAASAVVAPSTKTQTVRGHEASVLSNGSDTSLQWLESPGVVVGITVRGFTESDAVTFGNNLVSVNDAEWVRLLERSKIVNPPSWDRVVLDDW
jgi:hypothetical protein